MSMTAEHARGFALASGEGERLMWLGEPTILKITGAETSGRYAVAEVLSTPEGFVPLHVHNREDEAFLVLEGNVEFTLGEETVDVGPGGFVFGPRGVPHAYKVISASARIMMMFSPAGFEGFIRETSVQPGSPEESAGIDVDRLMETAARYGAEMLG